MLLVGIIVISFIGCTKETLNGSDSGLKIEKSENWTSINEEIFVSTGEQNKVNAVLVTSGKEAILIDTGYEEKEGLRIKDYIDKNELQLKNIIFTEYGDMQKGNLAMFKKYSGVKIISSFSTIDNPIITLGNKTIKVIVASDKHIIVEIDGDILVSGNTLTPMSILPTYSNYKNLINTLEKLKNNNYSLIIPSHGDLIEDNSILNDNLTMMNDKYSKYNITAENKWTVIDNDIFVSTGVMNMVNLVLVTSGNEATLIDTGYNKDEAARIKDYIDQNNLSLKNIIITHSHADHTANLDMFRDDNVNEFTYYNSNDNQIINMGDKKFNIVYTPGHNGDEHMSVEIDDKILVTGDIISSLYDPSYFLRFGGNEEHLIKTLEQLKQKEYTLIIPGHGQICFGDLIISDHLNKLNTK